MKLLFCLFVSFSLSNSILAQYFKSWDGVLYDANMKEFVIRGVNTAEMEWDYIKVFDHKKKLYLI